MKFPLVQGAYSARGVIANAQRCINLFPEPNPQDAPFPLTHYPASGTSVYADYTGVFSGFVRGVYWASSVNRFFAVIGTSVIEQLGPGQNYRTLGDLGQNSGFPISMSDNGLVLVIADGTSNSAVLTLATNAFEASGTPPANLRQAVAVVITDDINNVTTYYPENMELVAPDWAGLVAYNGVTLEIGMRVLVTAQSDSSRNGIYVIAQIGVTADPFNQPMALYRAADANTSGAFVYGMVVPSPTGNWELNTQPPITLDSTPLSFVATSATGSNHVDFIDTFFIFNRPGTPTFYVSPSNWDGVAAFDPLYYAEKIGYSDMLVCAIALHDTIWLIGSVTSEVWFNSGAADFPFQRMANSIMQVGCCAPYSPIIAANGVYWLSQDRYGRNMLMRGQGYQAQRVSNFAVESIWASYFAKDCISMVYQQGGHEILLLYFPADNATWGYDTTTGQFHQRTYGARGDAWLPYCMAYFGTNPNVVAPAQVMLAGDRTGPRILQVDRFTYTDCGVPINRIRAWPHLQNDEKRMSHTDFTASLMPTNLVPDAITLRWSDDGAQTWGNPVVQAAGGAGWPQSYGQYSWSRLGYARDRVYELSWTSTGETALNGAWVQAEPAET